MAWWRCGRKGCGAVYRLRLLQCPRCHGPELEEEESMAKITRSAGPSNASAKPRPTAAVKATEPEPAEAPDSPDALPANVAEETADEGSAEPATSGRRRGARSAPEELQP